jgi:methylaspartate ammonia-lyase
MRIRQAAPTSEMRAGYIQVDQAAVAMTSLSFKFTQGVNIKAHAGNTGFVYVGDAAVSSTNGFQLDNGEEVFLAIDDPSKIYVIGSADNQDVSWIGV